MATARLLFPSEQMLAMPEKNPFRLEQTLTYRLQALQKLSERISNQAFLNEAGLSLAEGRCLAAVGAFEPLSVLELGKYAHLDKGQASRAAQALHEKGFIDRQAVGRNGRGVMLSLSASGRKKWKLIAGLTQRRNAEIFSCLTQEEIAAWGNMLDRVISQLRASSAT